MKMSLYRPALKTFFQLSGIKKDSKETKARMNYIMNSLLEFHDCNNYSDDYNILNNCISKIY